MKCSLGIKQQSLNHFFGSLLNLFGKINCWMMLHRRMLEFLADIICWHKLCSPPQSYLLIINISSYFWKNNSLISHTCTLYIDGVLSVSNQNIVNWAQNFAVMSSVICPLSTFCILVISETTGPVGFKLFTN